MNEIKNLFLLLLGVVLAAVGIENMLYSSLPHSLARATGIGIFIIGLSAIIISLQSRKRQMSFSE